MRSRSISSRRKARFGFSVVRKRHRRNRKVQWWRLAPRGRTHPGALRAEEHYARGFEIEDGDPTAARPAYEACLSLDPTHREARINLGRLLHLAGALEEAEAVYRAAFRPDPVIAFNLGVLLEDLQREPEAIAAYRAALALDPGLADAHYNLARLHERAQEFKSSLRHLLAYRRMMDFAE